MPSKGKLQGFLFLIACSSFLLFGVFCSVNTRGDGIDIQEDYPHSIGYVRHYGLLTWEQANRSCGSDRVMPQSPDEPMLLCFEDRHQITNMFSQKELQNLEIWISRRDCNSRDLEKCLSLVVKEEGQTLLMKFENNCEKRLGFVCRKFTNNEQSRLDQIKKTSSSLCPETRQRNITWPVTPANTTVKIKCPNGMRGFAVWFCNGTTGDWGPGQPNLANCRSVALSNVLTTVEQDPQSQIIDLRKTSRELLQLVRKLETGGDLSTTVKILDRVEDIFVSQAPAMTPANRKQTALETSRHVINVCDQLLTKSQAWEDLIIEDRYRTATSFLTAVDETGSILATTVDQQNIYTANVVLKVVKPKNTQRESFVGHKMNNMTLSTGPKTKHVVFASYADLREILPLYQDADGVIGKIINSAVMSASTSKAALQGRVQIRLQHFNRELFNPTCVYWDVKRLLWASNGCTVLESNNEFTVCECNHLTNFAVLMDMHCGTCNLDEAEKMVLSTITVIGCSLSIVCLSVCIVIFTSYKSLWSMRTMIHRNLCICLLIGQAILLGGLDRTENQVVCAIIAGLLHYFFLAAFFWMFLEAFHILWLLIKVFRASRSHSAKYYMAGYGGPLIFLAVNIGFKHRGYGTIHFCWLDSRDGTIWGFIAPVIVIILFNTLTLAYALYTTHHIVKTTERVQPEEQFKIWIRGAAVLMPLLGITWVVGFLYVEKNFIIFAYIFAALNTLQGFAIFIFHFVMNKKVRHVLWKTLKITDTRSSRSPTSVTTPTRKRPASNFFFNQDHTDTTDKNLTDSSKNSPRKSPKVVAKEEIPFMQSPDDRDRTNTNELYPLDMEKSATLEV